MNKMIFPMMLLFGSIRAEFYLNQNELNIIADVSAELEIRGCIFFHNGSSDKDLNAGFKKLSSMGMFIVLINNESYINHELEWNYRNFSYIKSMVILREDNLLHTNELLSKLTVEYTESQ